MTGAIIHRVKKPRVPVCVIMLPTPNCEVTKSKLALERKRTHYWRNQERNKRIAQVAQAVTSQDRAALKKIGLRNKDVRVIKEFDKNKVAVLVESPEHGRELLPLLPRWRMLDMVEEEALKDVQEEKDHANMPVVMTMVFAAQKGIKADILIRATGTEWPLRIKGFPRKEGKDTPGEALIIDFDDKFDAATQEDTKRRVQEYKRQGMNVVTLEPLTS